MTLKSRISVGRLGIWAAAAVALAATFALYVQPDFVVTLADHIWACF